MNVMKLFSENLLPMGRMVSASKSGYRDRNPKNVVYFNANIVTVNDGKIWYGDLDLTKDGAALRRIAEELGQTLYVLTEMDGRFENEGLDGVVLCKKAVWSTIEEIPFYD